MDYQLVLQFRGSTIRDYDAMISLEDELIEALAGAAEVDGHDIGSGETNVFILTPAPVPTFDRAKVVLERNGLLGLVVAAYRPVSGHAFTVLWPHYQQRFSVA